MTVRHLVQPALVASIVAVVMLAHGVSHAQGSGPTRRLTHQLTIYVDEGVGQNFGHVFVELSDGKNRIVRGFYPQGSKTNIPQALGLRGSQVLDDADHPWNVKRPYNITQTGYNNARRVIDDFAGGRRDWSVQCYCGDLAEEVARAAGVPIELPANKLDFDARPKLFGAYLRQHGGIVNKSTSSSAASRSNANELCQAEYWRRSKALDACRAGTSACLDDCSKKWTAAEDLFSTKQIACNNSCRECTQEAAAFDEMSGKCNW